MASGDSIMARCDTVARGQPPLTKPDVDVGELGNLVRETRGLSFKQRIAHAGPPLGRIIGGPGSPYLRCLTSPNEREVEILDSETGKPRKMLMFACNSYLGLCNHPHVRERV